MHKWWPQLSASYMTLQIQCFYLKEPVSIKTELQYDAASLFLGILLLSSCSVMSDSLQPHELEPPRLICPWNFPGKNTGVGCHALLQGIFPTPGSNPCLLCWQADSLPFSSVQSFSHVQLLVTPWITARQASLSITNSWSLLKLMSIVSEMPSSHLILCCPLLLLPPIPPSITVFSNELTLRMRWPKYWSFSFSISPSNEHPGLISFRMD